MKRIFFVLCMVALVFSSCSKSGVEKDREENLYKNAPSSLIPENLPGGPWFYGTLSAISYWDRDGHQLGNDYEAGREFQFSSVNGQGRIKFWQYLGTRTSSSCVAEYYTYKEGTVVFNGDLFTFYPLKGNFKTIKKDCASGNGTVERKATAEDLTPVTFRWEIRNIENDIWLYTFGEDDEDHEEAVFVYQLAG